MGERAFVRFACETARARWGTLRGQRDMGMRMDLKGKAAFVNGTKRPGSAIAIALAGNGADVAVTWRTSRGEADEAARKIEALGRRGLSLQLDLSSPESVTSTIDRAAESFGG